MPREWWWDAVAGRALDRFQVAAVDADACGAGVAGLRDGDIDCGPVPPGDEAPEFCCAEVAEHGALTAGEYRGHVTAMVGELGAADREDAAVDWVEAARRYSMANGGAGETQGK